MKKVLRRALAAAIGLGATATLAGLLAPWLEWLELVNHFRPWAILAAAALLAAALALGARRVAAGLLLGVNLALGLAPLALAAPRAQGPPDLRVASFNLWHHNRSVAQVAGFVEASGADVVVLQEAGLVGAALAARVAHAYPHAHCLDPACGQGILSRLPFESVGCLDAVGRRPLAVWVRVAIGGEAATIAGVHLSYPFRPREQVAQVERLIAFARRSGGPLILAGDFNLTPFSWKLNALAMRAGLRRHVTFPFSWPADRLFPFVLIDNVLASRDFATIAARTGPRLGSDHLPVIVDVALRRTGPQASSSIASSSPIKPSIMDKPICQKPGSLASSPKGFSSSP